MLNPASMPTRSASSVAVPSATRRRACGTLARMQLGAKSTRRRSSADRSRSTVAMSTVSTESRRQGWGLYMFTKSVLSPYEAQVFLWQGLLAWHAAGGAQPS